MTDSEKRDCKMCGGTGIAVIAIAYVDEHNVVHDDEKRLTCHGCNGTGAAKSIQFTFTTRNHPRVIREDYRTYSRFACQDCGAEASVYDAQLAVLDSVVELPDVVDGLLTQSLLYRKHVQRMVRLAGEHDA